MKRFGGSSFGRKIGVKSARDWLASGLPLVLALTAAGCGRRANTPAPVAVSSGAAAPGVEPVDSVDGAEDVEEGVASWYGHPYHGRRTANGEVYDMHKQTAAHRTLPFDTWVKVVNTENGRSTTVRINDRGPFVKGRIIDLSRSAAEEIDMVGEGTAPVRVTILKSAPASAPDLYTVQVGAFAVEENARRLRDRLLKDYPEVFIEKAGELHRVRVGRLKTMDEANGLAERLGSEAGVESAMVVRLD